MGRGVEGGRGCRCVGGGVEGGRGCRWVEVDVEDDNR